MLRSFGQQKAKHFPILDQFEKQCTSDSAHPTAAPNVITSLLDLIKFMLLEDSLLGQGCVSLHNNNYFFYTQAKVLMECGNDFNCRKPENLLVYFRPVPNSVNECFLDHSMCRVLKKFNLTLSKVLKYIECFLPSLTFDL